MKTKTVILGIIFCVCGAFFQYGRYELNVYLNTAQVVKDNGNIVCFDYPLSKWGLTKQKTEWCVNRKMAGDWN